MDVPTKLTVVIVPVWVVSLVARALFPDTSAAFVGSDSAVLVIIAYWFSSNTIKRRHKDGED